MLFNKDLCDIMGEVYFTTIVNGEIENSKMFEYIRDLREQEDTCKSFISELFATGAGTRFANINKEVLKWTLEVSYHYYKTDRRYNIYYGYILTLAIMADDRGKIEELSQIKGIEGYKALLKYGTIDQVKWLYTVNPLMFDRYLVVALETVCELDLMEFIFSIHTGNHYNYEWFRLICHNDTKKRDIKTLEFIMSKVTPLVNIDYYFANNYLQLFKVIEGICMSGDDSFLQWLMINYPAEFNVAIDDYDSRCNIKRLVIAKCTLPTLKMFIQIMRMKITSADYKYQIANIDYLRSIAL